MKGIILNLIFIVFTITTVFGQEFETDYIKGKTSKYCAEENYSFSFDEKTFNKVDNYDGTKSYGPSKIEQTNYDDNGYYFEVRSPKYILNDYGINEYRKYYHFSHKILYNKRGGNVLYVYEIDMDSDVGKFYFTEKGYKLFCN